MEIESKLESIGLNAKEVGAYLSILSIGTASVSEIAKKCGVPRTTLYPALESLVERGLLMKEIDPRGGAKFSARAPDSFVDMLRDDARKLNARLEVAKELSQVLAPFFGKRSQYVPKLRFVEGKRAIDKLLYSAIHDWRRSYERIGDWTMWGYQDHTIVEEYRAWHEYAWKIRNPKERICLFSSDSGVGQQNREKIARRELRVLPSGHEFPCSIWIHADHVLFAVTSSKPHFAILLVDTIISQTLRSLFQLLWDSSESGGSGRRIKALQKP